MSRKKLPRLSGLPRTHPQQAPAEPRSAKPLTRVDKRSHVTAMCALAAFGWHVTKIRPDYAGDAPVLWRVTIDRYDGNLSITATEADPDVALDELTRYAAADH